MDYHTAQNNNWLKIIGKSFLFVALLFMLLSFIMPVFTLKDKRPYQMFEAFYSEKKDSVDAVMIGASNTYACWQSAIGWGDYGIAVSVLGFANLMPQAIRYYIEEARKTQPNALYIININNIKTTEVIPKWMTVSVTPRPASGLPKTHPTTDLFCVIRRVRKRSRVSYTNRGISDMSDANTQRI